MIRYRFIQADQTTYSITILCRVLGVAGSDYYAWLQRGLWMRQQEDQVLTEQIRTIHVDSRQS